MSDIIYTPPASSGGGTTINPTNDFIPVRSNATTFIDSNLYNVANTFLYSQNFGFNIDYASSLIQLGEYVENNNGTILSIDDTNQFISTYNQGSLKGLYLDFANNLYRLGDYDFNNNGTSLTIDDVNQLITTFSSGLKIDYPNATAYLGDYDNLYNGTKFIVDYLNDYIVTKWSNNDIGLLLDFPSKIYNIGDWIGLNNISYLSVDDDNALVLLSTKGTTSFLVDGTSDKLTFTTSYLNFVGATLQSNTSSGNSGEHLVITLNGSTYKIKLELP